MTDPLTITAIIAGVASAVVAIAGAVHYRIRIKCCCCQTDCTENETEKDIKRIQKVSSIKSI